MISIRKATGYFVFNTFPQLSLQSFFYFRTMAMCIQKVVNALACGMHLNLVEGFVNG